MAQHGGVTVSLRQCLTGFEGASIGGEMEILYATPYVSPITGALSVRIMERDLDGGHDKQVDIVAIDGYGTYSDEHHVPMVVMSQAFGKRFAGGGRYRQESDWDYPYLGDRIGCRVAKLE
jgi:hypothetical protein